MIEQAQQIQSAKAEFKPECIGSEREELQSDAIKSVERRQPCLALNQFLTEHHPSAGTGTGKK